MKRRNELIIRSGTRCRRYVLGKDVRPLATVGKRLYRTDSDLMVDTSDGMHSMVVYRRESTQPQGHTEYLDPDETMAMIDTDRGSGKNVSRIPSVNMELIGGAIAVLCVIYALVMGGL